MLKRFALLIVLIFTSHTVWALDDYNLALAGTATQNTTGFGGVASRANDGNTSGIYGNGSIQHSGTRFAES